MRIGSSRTPTVWENALSELRRRLGADLPIFLAQIGNPKYTSWQIAALWGMQAREVTLFRRCLCRESQTLVPEIRHLAADSPVHIIRKTGT